MTGALAGLSLDLVSFHGEAPRRGGRVLRAIETAPDCRLVALPGAAIATEVWALPAAETGRFIAGAEDIARFGGWRAHTRSRAAA